MYPTTGEWLFVTLRTQGLEFNAHVGPLGSITPENALAQWVEFVTLYNAHVFKDGEMQRIYQERFLARSPGAASLLAALTAKGFTLPYLMKKAN